MFVIAGIFMLKYEVEGEKNLPFEIKKIMVISTAEGVQEENTEQKWSFNIDQNNDLYIRIEKNDNNKKNEVIKNISIDNFRVVKKPEKGNIEIYRPAEEGLYKKENQYLVTEKLQYLGAKETNLSKLEIANQGGMILFRCSNENIGKYESNEDTQIVHDGTLIGKTDISLEQIQSAVSFDIVIETVKEIKYKATINLDLPVGDILKDGVSVFEKEDMSDIIFKRI